MIVNGQMEHVATVQINRQVVVRPWEPGHMMPRRTGVLVQKGPPRKQRKMVNTFAVMMQIQAILLLVDMSLPYVDVLEIKNEKEILRVHGMMKKRSVVTIISPGEAQRMEM